MSLITDIRNTRDLTLDQLRLILSTDNDAAIGELHAQALAVKQERFGNRVFMRGLIEISNFCRNNCLYCGIRAANHKVNRYRLSPEVIMDCCRQGYGFGFRTFVLQGGEDAWFTDERLCAIVASIRDAFPDCAITLSVGERSRDSYQRLFEAGADRYLLRHETADADHYAKLHPAEMSFENRIRCLHDLKEIGYQVGCGFMVGSPGQTAETLYADLQFIRSFQPAMVGIGPFVSTADTPFSNEPSGSVETTLRLLSLIRLLHPSVLLPATTALGSLHPKGRELGILAGANVVMPNLSPQESRPLYNIYDNKLSSGSEAAECAADIRSRLHHIGSDAVVDRGDYPEAQVHRDLEKNPDTDKG